MSSKAKKILIISAAVVVAIAAAITSIILCTDIPKRVEDMFDSDFRVMYRLDKYTGSDNAVMIPFGEEAEFKIKGCKSFSYKITANTDMEYTANGEKHSLGYADVGSILISEGHVDNGSIYFDGMLNNSLIGVLHRLHNGAEIVLSGEDPTYPYMLTVISDDKVIQIAFAFEFSDLFVKGVTVEPGNVTF